MYGRKVYGLVFVLVVAVAAGLSVLAAAEDTVLLETTSDYNTIVVTENDRGLRTLWFEKGGARQSVAKVGDPDHVELPYARAMPVGLALVDEPKRVLIVGLGGATIPNFLHKHFPRMTIDVVDIDPAVVDAARRFFGFREDATMHAFVADGRRFIEECQVPYDIIFLDAFGSENIPYDLATREFLQSVRKSLTPRGVAIGNIWSKYSNRLHDSMVLTYQDVFDELCVIEVRDAGNEILIAVPRPTRIEPVALERRARDISRRNGFRWDMGDVVKDGFLRPDEKRLSGQVLTDSRE